MSPSTSTAVARAPAVAGPSTVPTNAGAATATTADVAMTAAIDRTAARRCERRELWGAGETARGCRLEAIVTMCRAATTVEPSWTRESTPEPTRQEPRRQRSTAAVSSGSGLHAERSRRLARVDEIRDAGTEPYPYRFDRSHTLREIRDRWGSLEPGTETDDEVDAAGRLMLLRDSGKLVFATMRDRSGEIQLFVSKAEIGDDRLRRRQGARPR